MSDEHQYAPDCMCAACYLERESRMRQAHSLHRPCYATLLEALNQIAYLTRPGTRDNLMNPVRAFKERKEAYEWVQEAKKAAEELCHNASSQATKPAPDGSR